MQSPCRYPRSSRYFITAGVPPTACRSSCTYLPLGFRSASSGTRSLARWKSASDSGTRAVLRDGEQVQHGVGRPADAP